MSKIDEDQLQRVKEMTEKGELTYRENCAKHKRKIEKTWNVLEDIILALSLPDKEHNIDSLRNKECEFQKTSDNYIEKTQIFIDFLKRTKTKESGSELTFTKNEYERTKTIIDRVQRDIKTRKLDFVDTVSQNSSQHSSQSSSVKKRIEAEKERIKLDFMKKQAELKKQKAALKENEIKMQAESERKTKEIDVDLELLDQEKEIVNAEAAVNVLEEIEYEERGFVQPGIKNELTEKYVRENSQYYKKGQISEVKSDDLNPTLNPTALPFQPAPTVVTPAGVAEFTQFLLKKDLLLTRFIQFNDRPESFAAWKASFKNIISELNISAFEENDLLVKWLGPESRSYAESIRSANVENPTRGLERIWDRLEQRYGRPEMVENALKSKIEHFPNVTVNNFGLLYKLSDILSEIETCKENPKYRTLLGYFDASSGIRSIVNKLPYGLQEKWTTHASNYKMRHDVTFPPFSVFVAFIREMSVVKNDPAFLYDRQVKREPPTREKRSSLYPISNRKTNVYASSPTFNEAATNSANETRCPIHRASHLLTNCRTFIAMSCEERKSFLREKRICYRCCKSSHFIRDCRENVKCDVCGSNYHVTIMHPNNFKPAEQNGGESSPTKESVDTKCTKLCGEFSGRSCGKNFLVDVYPDGHPEMTIRTYVILDDQSNRSLASTELFDRVGVSSLPTEYSLSSCSGIVSMSWRRTSNVIIQSVLDKKTLNVTNLIECDEIPNNISEIPTPEVANCYPYLKCIASQIPPLDTNSDIHILIGRDQPKAHHFYQQITDPDPEATQSPFAQRLLFGWAIIGDVCLGGVHASNDINVNKTHILTNSQNSIFKPCENALYLEDRSVSRPCNYKGEQIFSKTPEDDKIGLSIEDRDFLALMDNEFHKNEDGHWTAPLPFRTPKQDMPNNRSQALRRAHVLDLSLKKDSVKREHFVTFMDKVINSGAAEEAPPTSDSECWYLPLFGVYHPKKPDSSAIYQGVSLNSSLMSGPDLTNSLLGILLRFRMDEVATTVDIEQMFYQFYVTEAHRNYLRFFWYKDNNPEEQLIEYRMKVHVFGNSPSPAIASYGLKKTVSKCEQNGVKNFVNNNFYVDDGLISLPNSKQAIELISHTQDILKNEGNIRLHKIASNSTEVMNAFPVNDLGKNLKNLCIGSDSLPMQHSLGLSWDLNHDTFVFDFEIEDKPYTKRGLLSTVNGLFDPLGFIAPITLNGKILLREAAPPGTDWDEPLSAYEKSTWNEWKKSLSSLATLEIPRMFTPNSLSVTDECEIHIFSDASEKAIAAVAYIKVYDIDGNGQLGFVMGKSKVAPLKGHTIPRLELCGALLATGLGETISEHLGIKLSEINYYTDSKVVLGYLRNTVRRFYTYVSNRVDRIRRISKPNQWSYVATDLNPADCGTRSSTSVIDFINSEWIKGPKWLLERKIKSKAEPKNEDDFPLVNPQEDREIRPNVLVKKTTISSSDILSARIHKYSSWKKFVEFVSLLTHLACSFKDRTENDTTKCKGWHHCSAYKTVKSYEDSKKMIIKNVQRECFMEEITCLTEGGQLSQKSSIIELSPYLDEAGILRVGGRLNKLIGHISTAEINPVILPKNHHASLLIIRHFHELIKHQGRHLTAGAIRKGGYWIIGAKRAISSLIHHCVICRKLRRDFEYQKMADLPLDRLTVGPPFTSVGVDTFGPWQVVTRKTRGGSAESKRWAIMFDYKSCPLRSSSGNEQLFLYKCAPPFFVNERTGQTIPIG